MKALYVTDREAIGAQRLEAILSALAAAPGLSVLIRERTACDRDVLALTRRARELLGPSVPLLVHRRFDLALAAGADGVHLPAAGLPLRRVKAATPRGFRVGVSTHSAAQAAAAIEDGADVVILGPVFDTPSKRPFGDPIGTAELERIPDRSTRPAQVYAIGGVDAATLPRLHALGDRIDGVAAIRFFQDAADPRESLARVTAP